MGCGANLHGEGDCSKTNYITLSLRGLIQTHTDRQTDKTDSVKSFNRMETDLDVQDVFETILAWRGCFYSYLAEAGD